MAVVVIEARYHKADLNELLSTQALLTAEVGVAVELRAAVRLCGRAKGVKGAGASPLDQLAQGRIGPWA